MRNSVAGPALPALALALFAAACAGTPPPDPSEPFRRRVWAEAPVWAALTGEDFTRPGAPMGPAAQELRAYFVAYDRFVPPGTRQGWARLDEAEPKLLVQWFLPPNSQPRRGTILALHGYLGSSSNLVPTLGRLVSDGWAVLALDLPGMGLSGGPRGTVDDFTGYAQAAARLLRAAARSPAVFGRPWFGLGHSTGASAWLELGSQELDGLAFIAPLIRPIHYEPTQPLAWLTAPFLPYHKPLVGTNDYVAVHDFPVSWALALGLWNQRLPSLPPQSTDLLLLQGTKDTVVESDFHERFLRSRFSRLEIQRVPDDHVLPAVEQAERLDPAILPLRAWLAARAPLRPSP